MSKISQYAALVTPATDDLLIAVDVHDTSMAPTGTDKNITVGNLLYPAAGVQALSNSSTITTGYSGVLPVSETGNVTGVILAAPSNLVSTQVIVVNRSAFTITFAASGTSNVAGGTLNVIPALGACTFVYDPGTSLWYPGEATTGGVSLDSTAGDFQPDGVQSAGSSTLASRADHVHPEKAWQSLLLTPSGALAETFPRYQGSAVLTPTTGTVYVSAIGLSKGTVVTNITVLTDTAGSSGTITHSWAALLDSTGKVVAVSADGLTTAFSAGAFITFAMVSPLTIAAAGMFYIAQSLTATGMCNWVGTTLLTAMAARTPVLCGTAGTVNAPPSVGTTLTISSTTANNYAYVS